ncbi:hypothetical protein LTR84_000398 [Exophiala bonariae]|uniref:Uncharacterized protein n=1 Tax=Exophiala bonariae TaxID=1690606 RepID=A0AAV9NT24_9EURO|nr:hypothetical protein LTR84_000398 [Exophiala bonariae]
MAVFYDLEDGDDQQSASQWNQDLRSTMAITGRLKPVLDKSATDDINILAAALTCYPIALSIAAHLDLNDLHALAASCRIVHRSLRQYAQQLKARSLRCSQDPTLSKETRIAPGDAYDGAAFIEMSVSAIASSQHWGYNPYQTERAGEYPTPYNSPPGLPSKSSACARDLVAGCRSCATVVCRNCTVKAPPSSWLQDRYRRLCKTCLDAPFGEHLQPLRMTSDGLEGHLHSSASSVKSERSFSASSSSSRNKCEEALSDQEYHDTPSSSTVLRGPCICASHGTFLCTDCGQNLRSADTTYKRVWTWRSRYSTHIGGGLGTGLGQGNQGQKCGRGEYCLDSSVTAVCWVEIDCAEGASQEAGRDSDHGSLISSAGMADYPTNKPGYFQQEIEGIGGVVKKKVKKRVKVGATVWEFEDERSSGKYLERESRGKLRSWCGWCNRVVPGEEDELGDDKQLVMI